MNFCYNFRYMPENNNHEVLEAIHELATQTDKRFENVDKKLLEHDEHFDIFSKKLLEHDERFDEMVTKDEFNEFRRETFAVQDQMITILKRLDQERIFTAEWVKRIEADVEKSKQDIIRMKQVLKIA